MFDNLTTRFSQIVRSVMGQTRLSEDNIKDALREVRMALLEADVALPVVRDLIDQVKARAVGQEVLGTLTPGQAFIRVVRDELIRLMGETNEALDLRAQPPAVVLMAGLQGSGKTTSVAKLARRLKERDKKSVMVVSCDIYRPAAIDQLQTLAAEVDVTFFPSAATDDPVAIARAALDAARKQFMDILIVDTAGRLHIDEAMMDEIKRLHQALAPAETLFVVDSMTGQDAVNTAKAFNEALELTGVILTKTDGDARGGAALSVRHVTGKPIKFLGVGEKTVALEPFYPDRIASRILGMGDVMSLIEEVEQKVDKDKALDLAQRIEKGKTFTLQDFLGQLQEMRKMGGVTNLLDKLPGVAHMPKEAVDKVNDRELIRMEAMINSMTPQERRYPQVLKASRKRRVAAGSGTQVQDVNRLLRQFQDMQKMMKQFNSKGMMGRLMRGMRGKIPGMPS
jgi:signal recognition particle subunit SRP54